MVEMIGWQLEMANSFQLLMLDKDTKTILLTGVFKDGLYMLDLMCDRQHATKAPKFHSSAAHFTSLPALNVFHHSNVAIPCDTNVVSPVSVKPVVDHSNNVQK
ncbi:hypothetical protein ACOSQ3_004051 [Xanthoceras sorbifolium]